MFWAIKNRLQMIFFIKLMRFVIEVKMLGLHNLPEFPKNKLCAFLGFNFFNISSRTKYTRFRMDN